MQATAYRWNQTQAAVDYDAAAPQIHPHYERVQDAVLAALSLAIDGPGSVVDLGGGSGRLAERVLESFPGSRVTIVDPSASFLSLARERLTRFGDRFRYVRARVQEPWLCDALRELLGGHIDAIVSTSALHHLEGDEKSAAFKLCHNLLHEGGVFVNGDEYRPPSDVAYRDLLEHWGEHMDSSLAAGLIPESFRGVIAKWRERNLEGFGGPRQSGDDCHETTEEQTARLYGAGFKRVEKPWEEDLWAVLVARR